MTNLEKLKNSTLASDRALANFIEQRGAHVVALVNASTFNRGDFFEMACTFKPVNRTGLHGISHGDAVIDFKNGKVFNVEIKLLTKKTGASMALQGTTATHYLIGFADTHGVTIRLIEAKKLKTRVVGGACKVFYQDNIDEGVEIGLRGALMSHDEAVEYYARQLSDSETALFYAEMGNDFLYTCGNGYEMASEVATLRALLKSLKGE